MYIISVSHFALGCTSSATYTFDGPIINLFLLQCQELTPVDPVEHYFDVIFTVFPSNVVIEQYIKFTTADLWFTYNNPLANSYM